MRCGKGGGGGGESVCWDEAMTENYE
jgi:hypothetical protein